MLYYRSADNTVCMFDRRNMTTNGIGSPVHKFSGHKAAVLCVQVLHMYIIYDFFILFYNELSGIVASPNTTKYCKS